MARYSDKLMSESSDCGEYTILKDIARTGETFFRITKNGQNASATCTYDGNILWWDFCYYNRMYDFERVNSSIPDMRMDWGNSRLIPVDKNDMKTVTINVPFICSLGDVYCDEFGTMVAWCL